MNRREARATRNGSSISAVLPADWVRGNGIRNGSRLTVWYGELVLVVPQGKEELADRLIAAAGGTL